MLSRMRGMLLRFRRDPRGLAAMEFAIILPVMFGLLMGMVEVSRLVNARSNVSQLTSTVADLVAQASAPNTADISNIYQAANVILYPYYKAGATGTAGAKPTIRITSVIRDTGATAGKVAWSCAQSGSGSLPQGPPKAARSKNSSVTLSESLLGASDSSVLMVEVAYQFSSPTTEAIAGSIPLKDVFYTRPRRVAQIPAPTCPT